MCHNVWLQRIKTKELNAGPAASKTNVEMHLAETWKPIKANVQNVAELHLKASEGWKQEPTKAAVTKKLFKIAELVS